MPDKIFTPYTLGYKKCRDEFDLQNNNSFQLKQIGRRQPPDNIIGFCWSNDSCYKNTGHKAVMFIVPSIMNMLKLSMFMTLTGLKKLLLDLINTNMIA